MKNPVFPRPAHHEPFGQRGALWGAMLCGLTALTVSGSAARAATYQVTVGSRDSGPNTLRQAILNANANPGADLIQFAGFTGFVSVDTPLPNITDAVTIRGVDDGLNDGRSIIIGVTGGDFRLFNIVDSDVTLAGLEVSGGRADVGGSINNGVGRLTLLNVKFDDNRATGTAVGSGGGAIYSRGPIVARGCILSNNAAVNGTGSGGAIYLDGSALELRDCNFENNRAARAGGAIAMRGDARASIAGGIFKSNFAQNGSGLGNGGALHAGGAGSVAIVGTDLESNFASNQGGALWIARGGTLRVDNASLVNNKASGSAATSGGGAIYGDGGTLVVRRTQLNSNEASGASGSGGAIFNNGGRLEFAFSSAALNQAQRAGGAIESAGDAASNVLFGPTLSRNSAGADPNTANPGNGGGLHISGAGRVFVVGGGFDRNTARAEGGALWNSSSGTLIVDNTSINSNSASGSDADNGGGGIYSDGGTTVVRNARLVRNIADGDVGSGGAILSKGHLQVVNSFFSGNQASRAGGAIETIGTGGAVLQNSTFNNNSTRERISGGNAGGGAFHMTDADTVFITGSTFEGNSSMGGGGALANQRGGTFNITNSTINNNELPAGAGGESGGIYNLEGTLNLRDVVVSNNKSSRSEGGGICNIDGTLIMRGGRVSGNSSGFSGGGIANASGKVILLDVILSSNSARESSGRGGALSSTNSVFGDRQGSNVLIVRGEVSNNTAGRSGGGLYCRSTTLVIDGTSIVGNKTNGDLSGGGGIYNEASALTVRNARLESNEVGGKAGSGGAVLNNGGKVSITNTTLRGNKVSGDGGSGGAIALRSAIFSDSFGVTSYGFLVISDSTLQDNQAASAGGAIENGGSLTVLRCTLGNNRAQTNGGALHTSGGGRAFVIDSTLADNTAQGDGGGLWNSAQGTLSVRNSTLDGNAANAGGGLYNEGGTVALDSATVTRNTAGNSISGGGGGVSNRGTLNSINSVIALNRDEAGLDIVGAFNSQGHNFAGASLGFTLRSGDRSGTAGKPLDPKLGDLGSNGGPTQTRLPQSGSPLIDAGNTSASADQRGIARPQGTRKDIGAVEVAGASAPSSPSAQSALKAAGNAPSGGSS